MNPDYKLQSNEDLLTLLQELEHSYAEAFADDTDAEALDVLWKYIKGIKAEIRTRKQTAELFII